MARILCLFFLFCQSFSYGETLKSLYWSENQNHLYDSIAYDLITNPEAVYSFVDRVQRQCALENNPAGIATSLVQKAYIYRVTTLNNIDSTIKLLYGAKKLALQLEDPVIISTVYADLTKSFLDISKLDSAFYYCTQSRKISRVNNLFVIHTECTINLASIYELIGKKTVAIELLRGLETLDYPSPKSALHQRMAAKIPLVKLLLKQNALPEAQRLIEEMEIYYDKVENKYWLRQIALMKANLFEQQGKTKEALVLLNKFIEERIQINHFRDLVDFAESKLQILYSTEQFEEMSQEAHRFIEFYSKHQHQKGIDVTSFKLIQAKYELHEFEDVITLAEPILTNSSYNLGPKKLDLFKMCIIAAEQLELKEKIENYRILFREELDFQDSVKNSLRISVEDMEILLAHRDKIISEVQEQSRRSYNWVKISVISVVGILSILVILLYRIRKIRRLSESQRLSLEKKLLVLKKSAVNHIETIRKLESQADTNIKSSMEQLSRDALDGNWLNLITQFKTTHKRFFEKLAKHLKQELSKTDERLAILMKLKMSDKEMMQTLNISESGLKKAKSRLRAKVNLEASMHLSKFLRNL